MKLNLGCSDERKPGYVGVDCAPGPAVDQIANLDARWPWKESTIDEIYAHDVFEHMGSIHQILGFPRQESIEVPGKIWCMNEGHRVLRPGGILDLAVPCCHMADGRVNIGAFADPTHRTYWTIDDCYFFLEQWNNPKGERGRLGPAYGITALFRGSWELREYGDGRERRAKIFARLEAVK